MEGGESGREGKGGGNGEKGRMVLDNPFNDSLIINHVTVVGLNLNQCFETTGEQAHLPESTYLDVTSGVAAQGSILVP